MGFEPTVELPRQQFSRLPDSAALAPLRTSISLYILIGWTTFLGSFLRAVPCQCCEKRCEVFWRWSPRHPAYGLASNGFSVVPDPRSSIHLILGWSAVRRLPWPQQRQTYAGGHGRTRRLIRQGRVMFLRAP